MPPKEIENGKIYCEINGELNTIGNSVEFTAEPENISDDDCARYFKGMELSFELTDEGRKQLSEFMKPHLKEFEDMEKLLKRTFWCNNWRKMHHLPLIRRRGKGK